MKPDRSNYEIWLIDWLDGTLTAQQTDELMAFLGENPDIREEADSLMLARIIPANDSFSGKKNLQKSTADINKSQIEYLSALYLEGDLSLEQEADLRQNIELYPENRIVFDNIQRTKLTPPIVHYNNKSRLRRISIAAGAGRISVIVLSAAAVIVFLILNHMFIPRPEAEKSVPVAVITPFTIYAHPPITISNRINFQPLTQPEKSMLKAVTKISSPVTNDYIALQPVPDSMVSISRTEGPGSVAFTSIPAININSENRAPALIASSINYTESFYDDERSKLGRFIARTFRNKILKEKQFSDEPLKTYELAEAGIDGLNRLFGWQMALVKTNNEAGELKSVYFSSKVLKFNAPVRKITEPQ